MNIIYEEDSRCLNCWPTNKSQGTSSATKLSLAQKLSSRTTPMKISLKRLSAKKNSKRIAEHKPSIDTLESTVHWVEHR